jgi:hypothetical protein
LCLVRQALYHLIHTPSLNIHVKQAILSPDATLSASISFSNSVDSCAPKVEALSVPGKSHCSWL